MTLEQQVCSLELAKKLKELGVKQESIFGWVISRHDLKTYCLEYVSCCGLCAASCNGNQDGWVSAFTVAELGKILPEGTTSYQFAGQWRVRLSEWVGTDRFIVANTEADARALLLIYLLENNLIKVEELNKSV